MYNSEAFISGTIDSVINQTYKNWELILIDDCSNDKTLKIVKTFINQNTSIQLIKNSSNKGAAFSRNKGIKAAKGDYIAFLDADDFAKPIMYEKLYEVAEEFDTDIVVCEADRVTPERKKISTKVYRPYYYLWKI